MNRINDVECSGYQDKFYFNWSYVHYVYMGKIFENVFKKKMNMSLKYSNNVLSHLGKPFFCPGMSQVSQSSGDKFPTGETTNDQPWTGM